MDRLGKVLAGSVMALALVAASAPAQATRIVFITHAQAVDDMVLMAQLIDAAVATKPDGLVVSIPDAEALGDSIRAAVAAGIPVSDVLTGPLFVTKDTAKDVIELSARATAEPCAEAGDPPRLSLLGLMPRGRLVRYARRRDLKRPGCRRAETRQSANLTRRLSGCWSYS